MIHFLLCSLIFYSIAATENNAFLERLKRVDPFSFLAHKNLQTKCHAQQKTINQQHAHLQSLGNLTVQLIQQKIAANPTCSCSWCTKPLRGSSTISMTQDGNHIICQSCIQHPDNADKKKEMITFDITGFVKTSKCKKHISIV